MRTWTQMVLGLVWAIAAARGGRAATLEVSYPSLEKMIVRRIMTDGGRYYLEGDSSNTCTYAFIQEPRVDQAAGRLRITVLFAGRAGKEFAGKCVGPGDNFDLQISGVPAYSAGELFLDDLKIRAPETPYFKIVRPLIERSLRDKLRYPVKERLDRAAAWATSATTSGAIALEFLDVETITLGESSLRLDLEFVLSIGK